MTTFGTSGCYNTLCTPPAVFRWRPLLDGGPDVTTDGPTDRVAADGESTPYDFAGRFIGIRRDSGTETINCGQACGPIAWSSRARILLVLLDSGYALWTREHGFRALESVLSVPPGWQLEPTHLALDGWTIAGNATSELEGRRYFRATLDAGALR